jgi:hypothetical protein
MRRWVVALIVVLCPVLAVLAEDTKTLSGRAMALVSQHKNAEALTLLRDAIDSSSNDADALLLLGVLTESGSQMTSQCCETKWRLSMSEVSKLRSGITINQPLWLWLLR